MLPKTSLTQRKPYYLVIWHHGNYWSRSAVFAQEVEDWIEAHPVLFRDTQMRCSDQFWRLQANRNLKQHVTEFRLFYGELFTFSEPRIWGLT